MINEIRKNAGLNEEFKDYAKSSYNNKSYAIYENPTSSDFKTMKKEEDAEWFRYIIKLNDNPVLYVFNSELLHEDAAKQLGIPQKSKFYEFGSSVYIDGKLNLSDGIKSKIRRIGSKNIDSKFILKYFKDIGY